PFLNRHLDPAIKDYAGATSQQMHPVPPTGQPEWGYYKAFLNRYLDPVAKDYAGATVQQQFVFPPNQPEQIRFAVGRSASGTMTGPRQQFDGATSQRTDPVPPVSQPEAARYAQIVDPRFRSSPAPSFAGATAQDTFPVPPIAEPEWSYYRTFTNRYLDLVAKSLTGVAVQQ